MKKFEMVVAELRAMAERSPAGTRLPADPELAKQFDVSRGTVHRALRAVEADGRIQSVQGRGRFVLGPNGEIGARTDAAYERIAADLTAYIADQPPGTRMPHVNDLAMHFKVSSITVRRVLRGLTGSRLLHTRPGKPGYFAGPAGA